MKRVLVITSSGNDEFGKWQKGGHGEDNDTGEFIIEVDSSIITVANGYPKKEALTVENKAALIKGWINNLEDAPSLEKALLVHGQKSILKRVEKVCKEEDIDLRDIFKGHYSSTDGNAGFNRYIRKFYKKESDTVSIVRSLFQWIWGETAEQITEYARRLQSDILSPLVALDLIQQAVGANSISYIPSDLKTEIDESISNLDQQISEFCGFSKVICDKFEEKLQKLRKPGVYSWDKYHEDLKDVAEKMEIQIQKIEA